MDTPRSSTSTTGLTPRGSTPTSLGGKQVSRSGATTTQAKGDSPAFVMEINKLRSDLRNKAIEANELAVEVHTLKNMMTAKDDAIDAAEKRSALAEERALQADGELASMRRTTAKAEAERKRLQSELDAANAEADRLNQAVLAGAHSGGTTNSEEMVRLHNQLAEARKEMRRLKDDYRGASNIIAAKDKALEEIQAEAAAAKEAIATRGGDQNVILDLQRQLDEAQKMLGGSERLGALVEGEVVDIRAALAAREAELEGQRELMAQMQSEVTAAQEASMKADRAAAEARADAATAATVAEKARAAEAARMREGGYISRRQHTEELQVHEEEILALQERVKAAHQEVFATRVMRERLLGVVDDSVASLLTADDVVDRFGSAASVVDELRGEVKELRNALAAKNADNAALLALRNMAVARAAKEKVEGHLIKSRLAQAIGEYDYTLEFNEPPPGPKEHAAAAAAAAAAAEAATASSIASIAAERDTALVDAAEAKLMSRQAQEIAEKAARSEIEAVAAREKAEQGKQFAETAAVVATTSAEAMRASLTTKEQELEGIRKAMAALREREQRRQLQERDDSEQLKTADMEVAKLTAALAAAKLAADVSASNATAAAAVELRAKEAELTTVKKELTGLTEKLAAAEAGHATAYMTVAQELEAVNVQLKTKTEEVVELKEKLVTAETTAAAAAAAAAAEIAEAKEDLGATADAREASVREELAETEAEVVNVKQELDAAVEKISTLTAQLLAATAAVKTAQSDSEDKEAFARQEALENTQKIAKLEEAIVVAEGAAVAAAAAQHAEQTQKLLQEQVDAKEFAVAELQEKVVKLESDGKARVAELESSNSAVEALTIALESAKERISDLETAAKVAAVAVAAAAASSSSPEVLDTPDVAAIASGNDDYHDDDGTLAAAAVSGSTTIVPTEEHLHELVASKVEVAQLKQKVDELESELAAVSLNGNEHSNNASAAGGGGGGYISDGSDEDAEYEDGQASAVREATPTPHYNKGNAVEGAGMTSATLASVLDRLLAARQKATATGSTPDDEALYKEAIVMLQIELARLGKQLTEGNDAAAQLRHEMGALQTAQLSAEATAELLEQHNALHMRVAALQIALGEKDNEFAQVEDSLLREISSLRVALKGKRNKGKDALRSMSRAVSHAARSLTAPTTGSTPPNEVTPPPSKRSTPFVNLTKRFSAGGAK